MEKLQYWSRNIQALSNNIDFWIIFENGLCHEDWASDRENWTRPGKDKVQTVSQTKFGGLKQLDAEI
jgi:hypothetical protein